MARWRTRPVSPASAWNLDPRYSVFTCVQFEEAPVPTSDSSWNTPLCGVKGWMERRLTLNGHLLHAIHSPSPQEGPV